ncbi:MAG: dihydrofolate reductase family protein [Actinomycetota bacterium]|nr:dihydrofolate reductase family protein [Actinomycetota bacterium]
MTPEILNLINTYRSDNRIHPNGNPWVLLNMITSSNGLPTLNGLSGPLGGAADKALFTALRGIADIIIVGYGTVRDEQYRPPQLTKELIAERESIGQSPLPTIAIVSNRLNFDERIPLLSSYEYHPVILTSSSSPEINRERISSTSEIFLCGENKVNLREGVDTLSSRFGKVILVEGGPSLNTQFVEDDLFDELCITTSPLHSDDESTIAVTTDRSYPPGQMLQDRRRELNGFVFTRFLRNREN